MKITIHRGLNQIGGCITEISTEKTRILIDLGQNLPDNQRRIGDILEKDGTIETLTEGEHQKKEYIEFRNRFSKVADIHTSGHATKECLAEVCTLTNPAVAIIPIHSKKSDEYLRLPISEELKAKVLVSCEIDGNQIEIKNM